MLYAHESAATWRMKLWSTRCSTNWPITWRAISTRKGSWILLVEQPDKRDQQRRLHPAGAHEQPQRHADVRRGGVRAAAFVHPVIVHQLAVIDPGAGDREAERAGERRLRPAGVGRTVMTGIAPHRAPGAEGVGTGQQPRRRADDEAGQARRDQVQEIVQPR